MRSKNEKRNTKSVLGGRGWVLGLVFFFSLAPDTWNLTPVLCADRLIASGQETNNLTQSEWNGTSGAISIDSAGSGGCGVHSGTYMAKVNTSASQAYENRALSSALTSGSIFVRMFACWDTFPSSGTPSLVEDSGSGGTTFQVQVVGGSSILRLRNVTTGTTQNSAQTISTGTWYRLECEHVLLDAGGSMTCSLYADMSTSALDTWSITGEDTLRTNVNNFYFGAQGSNNTSVLYMDDIIVNSSAGSAPFNTWPGASKIALLKPASNDTVTWTKTGTNCSGTTNADCVDDEPGTPDDASGYNNSSSANSEDRLNSASLTSEIPSDADMISLTVMDRWDGNGTTGTRQGRHLVWDESGAQTNGPTHSRCDVSAGNWSIPSTAQITAFDLGTRSKADIESFDLGYEPLNNQECRVTAIWANVEWKEASPATASPRRRRMVVW